MLKRFTATALFDKKTPPKQNKKTKTKKPQKNKQTNKQTNKKQTKNKQKNPNKQKKNLHATIFEIARRLKIYVDRRILSKFNFITCCKVQKTMHIFITQGNLSRSAAKHKISEESLCRGNEFTLD